MTALRARSAGGAESGQTADMHRRPAALPLAEQQTQPGTHYRRQSFWPTYFRDRHLMGIEL